MTDKLKQIIKEEIAKLPKEAQEAINSLDWGSIAEEIGKRHLLTESEINDLQVETLLVLVGTEEWTSYIRNVENQVGTTKDEAVKINEEVIQKIFNPIAEKMPKTTSIGQDQFPPNMDERFERLSKETQKIIAESNYQATLYNIAKEYNLNVEQMGVLEKVVTNLIIGALHPDAFEDSLEGNLKLDSEKAKELANEINEKIFRKIREKIITPVPVKSKSEEQTNANILSSQGIKIIPEKLELEEAHPILAQKLSGTFQTPVAKTDHSIENITKNVAVNGDKTKSLGVDPYREIPE